MWWGIELPTGGASLIYHMGGLVLLGYLTSNQFEPSGKRIPIYNSAFTSSAYTHRYPNSYKCSMQNLLQSPDCRTSLHDQHAPYHHAMPLFSLHLIAMCKEVLVSISHTFEGTIYPIHSFMCVMCGTQPPPEPQQLTDMQSLMHFQLHCNYVILCSV